MNWKEGMGLLSVTLVASATTVWGIDNPYQDIVTRNAFALKPIPEAPKPGENQAPPTSVEVLLTGISTLGGGKKVLLQITDKAPGKKPMFPPPLVEGDIQERVEVVSIDPEKGAVMIKIDGNEKTLTFEKDAPKPGGGAPAGAIPPPPGGMPNPGAIPLPGVTTAGAAAAALNGNAGSGRFGVVVGGGAAPAAPTAGVRPGSTPGTVNYGAAGATAGSVLPGGVPARPMRTTPESYGNVMVGGGGIATGGVNPNPQGTATAAPVMTREQSMATMQEQNDLMHTASGLGLTRNKSFPPALPVPGQRSNPQVQPSQ